MNDTALNNRIESRLLCLAALFLILNAAALTISPAIRARSWSVEYRWDHWLGVSMWLAAFILASRQASRWLPRRDPYLLPIAALLTGWGILTIWRLLPTFGLRQSLWLFVGILALVAGLRFPGDLDLLRRYKYLWLTGSLSLTALTLILGTNPMGYGPRMWLGCCGVYLQPSEPLKLLFIAYLAAYMADHRPFMLFSRIDDAVTQKEALAGSTRRGFLWLGARLSPPLLSLLAPTLIMIGLALALLVVQRDLGTASIFFFLYAAIVYVTTSDKRVLVVAILALLIAGLAGYALFDVVRVRVDAWINPWLDPSGRSYQVVQSLIAIANGGLPGRGPGVGNPGLVPVTHSDLIYAAILEEAGLVGAIGMLAAIALMAARGLSAALQAPDAYRSYLAAGLTAYLVGQSLLIIYGCLRLLPLTGIPLPFVSYGGSSLLTSFLSLLLLLHISNHGKAEPAGLILPYTYMQLGRALFAGLAIAALATGWWSFYRAPDLVARTDNPRRAIADRSVRRGAILDRNHAPINTTDGQAGEYIRRSLYPDLGNVVGYTNSTFGQSGLEASLDDYLRGLSGNPAALIWQQNLLYGQPPPGLDVRLSLDLSLQRVADQAFDGTHGALVLLDAQRGDILVMASLPTFDPNRLDEDWDDLIEDPDAPLLNRATQGRYSPGAVFGPVLLAQADTLGGLPPLPVAGRFSFGEQTLSCALLPDVDTWPAVIASGCPAPVAALGEALGAQALMAFYHSLGLYEPPRFRLPGVASEAPGAIENPGLTALGQDLQVSPLQAALALAALSANGIIPAPRLALAVHPPQEGWLPLPAQGEARQVLPAEIAREVSVSLALGDSGLWGSVVVVPGEADQAVTWYVGGSISGLDGAPFTVVVLIEEDNPILAEAIGRQVLDAAAAQ